MWGKNPLIRTIQDDPSPRCAEILAGSPGLVPTGIDESAGRSTGGVDWQAAMKRAVRSTKRLRQLLDLPPDPDVEAADQQDFPTFVPIEFLRRIKPGCPDDPLLRQVMATAAERNHGQDFIADPVGDLKSVSARGLIHKYHGRVLLISTGACGVHCRYCFRREFPYDQFAARADRSSEAIQYLNQHAEVDEVILSGGDPLTLVDATLCKLIDDLETIAHLRRLRIHTRMPVVIPQRVTPPLVQRLKQSRLAVWVVVHANHAQELDADVLDHIGRLIDAGIPVLNQAVLLRGVNDQAEALIELSRRLVDHRITPYYLHQLDRVRGAEHFLVPEAEGVRLVKEMQKQLPGYAVPQYVREDAGLPSKNPMTQHGTEI